MVTLSGVVGCGGLRWFLSVNCNTSGYPRGSGGCGVGGCRLRRCLNVNCSNTFRYLKGFGCCDVGDCLLLSAVVLSQSKLQ